MALLHHKFTAAGKEEFSETLRKFLREKSPDTVVVGWGNGKSAGRQGENYHAFIVSCWLAAGRTFSGGGLCVWSACGEGAAAGGEGGGLCCCFCFR